MLSSGRASIQKTLRRQQPSIQFINAFVYDVEPSMLATQIQRGSRCDTLLRRPLSTLSIVGTQQEWSYKRTEICDRNGREYNCLYDVHSMLQNGRSYRSYSQTTHSLLNGVSENERNVTHEGWNSIRQSNFFGCIHAPHRWEQRRLHILPPYGMQFSYFSSMPSLKPKDDKPTAANSTVSTPTSTDSLNAAVKATASTTATNIPLPSRKLGKTAVPTPPSAPPPDANPLQSLKDATPKSVIRKGVDLIVSASKVVVTQLMKLPGNIFFYATHPAETKAAYIKLRDSVKHEIHHYWVGTKLLWADIVTARKLLNKTLEGSALTRRERKQLLRTVSDLFRLIPFSMFVIVPFMEFALPFALRLFPNMLPSTYQDSLKAEENMKRELKSRIAMAQFFQE